MNISSINPGVQLAPQVSAPLPLPEVAQRRQLISAARAINASGLLGHNQLVFVVDRQTHRPVIRVEDPDTHEVLLQLPAEYVLRLSQDLKLGSAHTTSTGTDM
jgi:uncharacterized FlaG/YvyC family protein